MTEQEAQRMLDEHRVPARFVRGRNRYVVRRDGKVDVYRLTKSGKRAIFEMTLERDSFHLRLHPEIRRAVDEARA